MKFFKIELENISDINKLSDGQFKYICYKNNFYIISNTNIDEVSNILKEYIVNFKIKEVRPDETMIEIVTEHHQLKHSNNEQNNIAKVKSIFDDFINEVYKKIDEYASEQNKEGG